MKLIIILLLVFSPLAVLSQNDSIIEYFSPEPQFPCGYDSLRLFISDNIVYPDVAIENEDRGVVVISFIIEVDGSLSTIRIENPVSKELDREVKRVIKLMPKWEPVMQNGVTIRARCQLPITFATD